MIEKGKTYKVYDGEGRYWGSVCLKYPFSTPILGSKTISGYLEASPEFKDIHHLFLEHEKFMSETGVVEDEANNLQNIASLGVILLDPETDKKQNIGPVFVSNELLFTCDAEIDRI